MNQIHAEASAIIKARPEDVYAILLDYHQDHHAILPPQFFSEMVVEEGGTGAGTVVRVEMSVMGVKQTYRMEVTEPEPGSVLKEADEAAGVVTTFTVDPLNDGQAARVTIATDTRPSPGIMGFMEKLMNPIITRHIYKHQLQMLADYVRNK